MSTTSIIWVHADALSRDHPVFDAAPRDARAIYVWDADDIARRGWSLKRCVFVLDCLADMNAEIVQGQAQHVLDGYTVFTASTVDPHRRGVIKMLGSQITVIDAPSFVTVPDGTDMGRFFRYWNKAKGSAMTLTEKGTSR